MKQSPLQLDNHFFIKVSIEASAAEETTGDIDFFSEVTIKQHAENENMWLVQLRVATSDDVTIEPNYKFDVEVVGMFSVSAEYSKEKASQLVEFNGPAVLFGSIREMISNITSRGPMAQFDLPTVTFISNENSKGQSEE